jgi:precorrin-6B methylase 1
MAKDAKVVYGEKNVELSREYPFGETSEIDTGKEKKTVTVLRLNETNGYDEESILKSGDDTVYGYAQIAVSAGIEYSEALMLAKKDYVTLTKELEDF